MNLWKRGKNQWTLTWEEGRDADGRRQRRRETFRGSKHEAEAYWRRVQQQIETGTATQPTAYTVGGWMTYWLTQLKASNIRPTTYRSYAALITYYITPTVGSMPLAKLSAMDVQHAVDQWLTQANHQHPDRPVSRRRVRYALTVLRSGLEAALRWQLVGRNVARLVDMPPESKQEWVPWSAAHAQRFLESSVGHRYWIAWALALMTGLRVGEILGLTWEDIDWDAGTLRVARVRHEDGSVGPPKTARGRRIVALDGAILTALRHYRKAQVAERVANTTRYDDQHWVVAQASGRSPGARALVRAFKAAIADAGVPEIRFHDLRHGHATFLIAAKIDPRTVADRLGHVSVSFTLQTYVHASLEAQRFGAAAVSAQLLPGADRSS